jgi:hypothetical protein
MTDADNCGGCGTVCAVGDTCVAGTCTPACSSDQTYCFGACLNTDVNHNNCGSCGHACTTAQDCVGGQCVCNAAHPDVCMGACVNEQNDPTNCGACGHACPSNMPSCVGGQCRP